MGNLQKRVERIEERFGMGREDEVVEFRLSDGTLCMKLTRGAFKRIMAEVMGRNTRLPQKGALCGTAGDSDRARREKGEQSCTD